jgi:dihydrofolate reductase
MLSLIVAMARNRVIGLGNRLPWYLPADLQFFKRITLGKPILMGRRTFESLGRPLPGRINIVITGQPDYQAEGCIVVHSLADALAAAGSVEEIMVIGGASLYAQTLERADRIYLTLVAAEPEGDVRFPELERGAWQEVWREDHPADARHAYPFSFILLERQPVDNTSTAGTADGSGFCL